MDYEAIRRERLKRTATPIKHDFKHNSQQRVQRQIKKARAFEKARANIMRDYRALLPGSNPDQTRIDAGSTLA
ncbi:hypothetical protein ACFPTO_01770 [Paraburkholderia denitrificans]|uniref:Integrase n=1 Tax=Paraburkholderia denitrificans TaxID=694025 RepID=A0ABW0J3D5_9BURK